jgi:hypothetical protein
MVSLSISFTKMMDGRRTGFERIPPHAVNRLCAALMALYF